MKRRHSEPLLQAVSPDVYLIDTSAWFDIDSRADAGDVWRIIVTLIEDARVFFCAQVLHELRGSSTYESRLKRYEKALSAGDRDDIAYLQHVGKITHDYPAMSKPTGSKTPADPYVIALAELEGYVVVADESMKRPNRKIPGVCKQRGIRYLTLTQFISKEK